MKIFRTIFSTLLLAPVYFYKGAISPYLSPSCRHTPSCSTYAIDAIKRHGPLLGLALGTNRILRCRPGGTWGYDPVPLIWIKRFRPLKSWIGIWKTCNRLKYDEVRN